MMVIENNISGQVKGDNCNKMVVIFKDFLKTINFGLE